MDAGLHMADVGLAVGGGRAVVKDVGGRGPPAPPRSFQRCGSLPRTSAVSFSRSTKFRFVETSLYMLMAAILSLVCVHRNRLKERKSLRPAQTGRRLGFAVTTHSGISNNTRPGNGGGPALLTGALPAKGNRLLGPRLGRDAECVSRAGSHQPPALWGALRRRLSPSWPLLPKYRKYSITTRG